MENPADQKKICPRCRKAVPRIHRTCPYCGYDLTSQIPPSVIDREYLAKDTWSDETDHASTPATHSSGSPSLEPVGIGYEGHRSQNRRFTNTVGISSELKLGSVESARASEQAPSRRRDSRAPKNSSSPPPFAASPGSLRLGMDDRMDARPPVPNSLTSLAVTSVVLMAAWLLPDVWKDGPIFPISKLDLLHGLDLLAALAHPVAGALCLILVALPIKAKLRCLAAAPVLLAALGLPVIITPLAASAESGVAVALSALSIPAALVAFLALKTKPGGHITLMLIPGGLLALVLQGAASGSIPLSLVAAYKAPFELWALTFGITACLGNLLGASGRSQPSISSST